MYKVYKITNTINGKIYFGYTGQTLPHRLSGHYSEPRNTIISRSIRKYGVDKFTMEQLFEYDQEQDAKQQEILLIAEHQTNILKYPNGSGMNMTDGGEGCRGYTHSQKLKQKWSIERKGKRPSTKANEMKRKAQIKTVYIFTTTGELIKTCESTTDAGIFLNVNSSNISKCCNNIIVTVKGHVCQYTEHFIPRTIPKRGGKMFGSKNPQSKPINLFNERCELVSTYNSVSELAQKYNLNPTNVAAAARGKSKKILPELYVSYENHYEHYEKKSCKRSNYVVLQHDLDGTIINTFDSVKNATKSTGVKSAAIHSCLCGAAKTGGGYMWSKSYPPEQQHLRTA